MQTSAAHAAKEHQALDLINQDKFTEAEILYRELAAAGSTSPAVYGNLGALLNMKGDTKNAILYLKQAINLNPNFSDAHNNLGNAFQQQGNFHEAISSFNSAIQANPSFPIAYYNLGKIFQEIGDLEKSAESFKEAIMLNPGFSASHNSLGNVLQEFGDLAGAISSYNNAIRVNPDCEDAHNNIGVAFQEQGDLSKAIYFLRKALQLNPNSPETYKNLSHCLLSKGDFSAGWDAHEWRIHQKAELLHAHPKCMRWMPSDHDQQEIERLLLISEQGIGDTLQFMRYLASLKQHVPSVSLCAPLKLHSLIRESGIDPSPFTPEQANEVKDGAWMPLLSVPRYLSISPDNPISIDPYIKTTDELTEKWAHILKDNQHPIVGINWQGNQTIEKRALSGRSLQLETFAPIADVSQISLLSLQKGFGSDQMLTCSFKDRFVNCQDQINETWDFLETAAIIANCDLIITSDTAVAHLAGGMGKTTWLLLHKSPDWRWGLEGETTFWYPSMRLFRQKLRADWNEVIMRVTVALQERYGSSSSTVQSSSQIVSSIKNVLAPISIGELIDKITILQIKTKRLQGRALANARRELLALNSILDDLNVSIDISLVQRLKRVNEELWEIEDNIRDQEKNKKFDEEFIQLARSVYFKNDARAAIKKEINIIYGSDLIEEKHYLEY